MRMKRVPMSIDDLDGSACAVLGRFERRAWLYGWPEDEVDRVVREALAGYQEHLLRTLAGHIEEPADGAAADPRPVGRAAEDSEVVRRVEALARTFLGLRDAPGCPPGTRGRSTRGPAASRCRRPGSTPRCSPWPSGTRGGTGTAGRST